MKLYDCEQLSEAWFELHRGRPTASRFGRIITPRTGKLAAGADDLICELVAERFYPGQLIELAQPPSRAMLHGTQCEPEARRFYEMEVGRDVREVGFLATDDERFGASPDGLVGEDGGLELKCPQGKTQVRYLLDGVLPDDYRAQVHGCLIVSGRAWWDFLSYCPGLPPFLIRTYPDEFTVKLLAALEEFWDRYQGALSKLNKEAA